MHRTDIHDAPASLLTHLLRRRSGAEEVSGDVSIQDLLPFCPCDFVKTSQYVRGRVVDEDIQSPHPPPHLLNSCFRRYSIGEIYFPSESRTPGLRQFLRPFAGSNSLPVQGCHAGPLGSEKLCGSLTYAAAC